MQRTAVAVVTVLLFAIAGAFFWIGVGPREAPAICARVGFVMAALWVAMPSSGRAINWWLVGLALALVLGFARLPRHIKLLAVGSLPFFAAWFWVRRKRVSP